VQFCTAFPFTSYFSVSTHILRRVQLLTSSPRESPYGLQQHPSAVVATNHEVEIQEAMPPEWGPPSPKEMMPPEWAEAMPPEPGWRPEWGPPPPPPDPRRYDPWPARDRILAAVGHKNVPPDLNRDELRTALELDIANYRDLDEFRSGHLGKIRLLN